MRKASQLISISALALGMTGVSAFGVDATFVTPAFFGNAHTTYQEWNPSAVSPLTPAGPNAPAAAGNPNGTANAYDSTAATDEAFNTSGGNLYSFSFPTHPRITVPSANLGAAWNTEVILQVRTLGSIPDVVSPTLTPFGGSPVAVLPGDVSLIAHSGSGMGAMDYYMFTWDVPGNAASYTLDFAASESSMSWAGARVDTLAVPEPASLSVLGFGAAAVLWRRRRR